MAEGHQRQNSRDAQVQAEPPQDICAESKKERHAMQREAYEYASIETIYKHVLPLKIRPFFIYDVNPKSVVVMIHAYGLNGLNEQEYQEIRHVIKREGDQEGAECLLKNLVRYPGWLSCLLKVLRDPRVLLDHVAKNIESVIETLEQERQNQATAAEKDTLIMTDKSERKADTVIETSDTKMEPKVSLPDKSEHVREEMRLESCFRPGTIQIERKVQSETESSCSYPAEQEKKEYRDTSEDIHESVNQFDVKLHSEKLLETETETWEESGNISDTGSNDDQTYPKYAEISTTENKRYMDILLVGKTGNGKSSLGNSILRKDAFESSNSMSSFTKEVQFDYSEFDDIYFKVVDGPGVGDTNLDNKDGLSLVINAMSEAICANPEGYHAILIVVRFGGKFTEEDVKTLKILKDIFGEGFIKDHAILVVTYGDLFYIQTRKSKETFSQWCDKQGGAFKQLLLEVQNRVVLFDNMAEDDSTQEEQLRDLVSAIDGLSSKGLRYNNDKFEEAKESRDRIIVESEYPTLHESALREAALISQHFNNINLSKPEQAVKFLKTLLERAQNLIICVKEQDRNTGVLSSTIEFARNVENAINQQIKSAFEIIEVKQKIRERRLQQLKVRSYTGVAEDTSQTKISGSGKQIPQEEDKERDIILQNNTGHVKTEIKWKESKDRRQEKDVKEGQTFLKTMLKKTQHKVERLRPERKRAEPEEQKKSQKNSQLEDFSVDTKIRQEQTAESRRQIEQQGEQKKKHSETETGKSKTTWLLQQKEPARDRQTNHEEFQKKEKLPQVQNEQETHYAKFRGHVIHQGVETGREKEFWVKEPHADNQLTRQETKRKSERQIRCEKLQKWWKEQQEEEKQEREKVNRRQEIIIEQEETVQPIKNLDRQETYSEIKRKQEEEEQEHEKVNRRQEIKANADCQTIEQEETVQPIKNLDKQETNSEIKRKQEEEEQEKETVNRRQEIKANADCQTIEQEEAMQPIKNLDRQKTNSDLREDGQDENKAEATRSGLNELEKDKNKRQIIEKRLESTEAGRSAGARFPYSEPWNKSSVNGREHLEETEIAEQSMQQKIKKEISQEIAAEEESPHIKIHSRNDGEVELPPHTKPHREEKKLQNELEHEKKPHIIDIEVQVEHTAEQEQQEKPGTLQQSIEEETQLLKVKQEGHDKVIPELKADKDEMNESGLAKPKEQRNTWKAGEQRPEEKAKEVKEQNTPHNEAYTKTDLLDENEHHDIEKANAEAARQPIKQQEGRETNNNGETKREPEQNEDIDDEEYLNIRLKKSKEEHKERARKIEEGYKHVKKEREKSLFAKIRKTIKESFIGYAWEALKLPFLALFGN